MGFEWRLILYYYYQGQDNRHVFPWGPFTAHDGPNTVVFGPNDAFGLANSRATVQIRQARAFPFSVPGEPSDESNVAAPT